MHCHCHSTFRNSTRACCGSSWRTGKVARMAGRLLRNLRWLEMRLSDPDPRVRANAVESLWGVNSPEARSLFLTAARDPHHRVHFVRSGKTRCAPRYGSANGWPNSKTGTRCWLPRNGVELPFEWWCGRRKGRRPPGCLPLRSCSWERTGTSIWPGYGRAQPAARWAKRRPCKPPATFTIKV